MIKILSFNCIIFIIMSICAICCSEQERNTMNNDFFEGVFSDDSVALDNVLTNEYHLEDLISFFGLGNYDKSNASTEKKTVLVLTKVNLVYPIEIIRVYGSYSVYKVIEGGYFYVFWAMPINRNAEPSVYLTSYLVGNRDSSLFDGLDVGIHTVQDVEVIDPSLEIQYLMSRGIFSYSYLDQDNLFQIEYTRDLPDPDSERLTIAGMTIVKRSLAPSIYRIILSDDLPNIL